MIAFNRILVRLAALCAAAVLLCASPSQAQTIANTAGAVWTSAGTRQSAVSNTVTFDVQRTPVRIDVLHAVSGAGENLAFLPARCAAQGSSPVAGAAPASAISVQPVTTLRIGENLIFRITAPGSNRDPVAIETLIAIVRTSGGDAEALTVSEVAPNSGIFAGSIATASKPPAAVPSDCRLSTGIGETITVEYADPGAGAPTVSNSVAMLADPYGLVFDSEDGSPVDGAVVTLIDAQTGAPAQVFADDGVTSWPSTVTTGGTVHDSGGNIYQLLPGEYRFPLARLGSYRIVIAPPSPYTAPSGATPAQLSGLFRPDGEPLQITAASYGGAFALASLAPVRVDIPLDRPALAIALTKTASRRLASAGDAVIYTIRAANTDPARAKRGVTLVDTPSPVLRLRPDSVRIDGEAAPGAVTVAADGRTLSAALGDIPAGAVRTLTYVMSVRDNAPQGQAVNRVEAKDSRGLTSVAEAVLRINGETIAQRMTIIGRITDGGCRVDGTHSGVPNVRLILEDGSFAITDKDGRYHFEGVMPGSHVVQAAAETLPGTRSTFADCVRSTRSAGTASSRFVTGQGGSLAVVDFAANLVGEARAAAAPEVTVAADRDAAGGATDWLALGDGPAQFLFPGADHNPRAPAVRVVIRHRRDQTVELSANGTPVDPVAFDGARVSPQGFAVSIWRGIPLTGETTHLAARIRNADGSASETLSRDVAYASTPARVEWVRERSRLTADGATRPVVAVRVVDHLGRPVHSGLTGTVQINAPYESAASIDAMQSRQLSGLDRAAPTWTVKGDDGVALVELAPTMVSGPLHLDFVFTDQDMTRRQTLDTWIEPGDQKWTLVGLAEGTVGARSVANGMERSGRFDSDLGKDARVAFYAKGKVRGRYLLTLAYDSAKQKDEQRLFGAIDPKAYYTVFADGSDRRFDAASREKLYVRIEASTFYALYGDFITGFDQTQLARYQRVMTGVKAEARLGAIHVQGFAAKSGQLHRRDEIQGAGLSGPYRLSSRDMVQSSETVTIEVRDRFRSELVVSSRSLTRFVDYTIDELAGTIAFREPILSRDAELNPQFIVIDYDAIGTQGGKVNAGLRADATVMGGAVRIGASAISDTASADGARSQLAALDVKARLSATTELRAEAALSRSESANAQAWLVEVEHHDGQLDLVGYVRSVDDAFGLGQVNGAEQGRRKIGIDGRLRLSERFAVTASAWHDVSLTDTAKRDAVEVAGVYRTADTELRAGITHFADRLSNGETASSTVVEAAVTRRLLDNRLEVTGAASQSLGASQSIDLPSRYRLGVRYAVTPAIKLTGDYEIAQGDAVKARTARGGFEIAPWAGARLVSTVGQQDIAEFGKRSFANFGVAQSLQVTRELTIDATIESARTLGRFDAKRLVNAEHPASSGGVLGGTGTLAEDFTAMTLGATWRREQWTATARAERRDGALADRTGLTLGAIRQLGDGTAIGGGFTWTRAEAAGSSSEVMDGAVSAAIRPAGSALALLTKLEYRSDAVTGAIAGEAGPAGRSALTVDGDARSRRLIGSVSANWSPTGADEGLSRQRSEVGLFVAVRHNFDRVEGFDLSGTSLLAGTDLHIGIGDHVEIGATASVRHSLSDRTTSFAVGPQIGVSPARDVLVTVGYNVSGFRDRDFGASRNTSRGLFAAVKMKFDAGTFGFLGLNRR